MIAIGIEKDIVSWAAGMSCGLCGAALLIHSLSERGCYVKTYTSIDILGDSFVHGSFGLDPRLGSILTYCQYEGADARLSSVDFTLMLAQQMAIREKRSSVLFSLVANVAMPASL